jgi:hypothetical protein
LSIETLVRRYIEGKRWGNFITSRNGFAVNAARFSRRIRYFWSLFLLLEKSFSHIAFGRGYFFLLSLRSVFFPLSAELCGSCDGRGLEVGCWSRPYEYLISQWAILVALTCEFR